MASLAKHFVNDPTALVHAGLRSVTYANPAVALDEANKILYERATSPNVSIVSGGGSGHEPSFGAMVGPGLLTGAVAGTIFASPSAEQIRTAITLLASRSAAAGHNAGVLVTVMNYTGDVLNFGMAVEKARAAGVPVRMVVVGDDVGVGRAKAGKVGRRGIAGTVLVHKISGALAARGFALDKVADVAQLVADNLVSVGASLEHVHVPGRSVTDTADDALAADEVEIGMGIHNEPGSERAKGLALTALVRTMLRQLLDAKDSDRAFASIGEGEDVVLLVNNLGAVSVLEMGGIAAEVVEQLRDDYKLRPRRVLSGTYMTSLNGLGFSISLLKVPRDTGLGADVPSLLQLLDDPAEATGWSSPIPAATWDEAAKATPDDKASAASAASAAAVDAASGTAPSNLKADGAAYSRALQRGLQRVIAAEPEITQYDTVVGDGDCGTGMKRGAEAILEHLSSAPLTGDVVADVAGIVPVVERSMDGTSGALYAIFLNALVHALRQQSAAASGTTAPDWAAALRHSCDTLSRYTPARPGDRTLVDALYPFVDKLAASGSSVADAAAASRAGAEHTKGMKASLGRTVYVGGSGFEKVPDPGAWGLACFFEGLAE
ncbi:dihydroxyacetone kinase [Sporothrix schenckii 1099-18]|uniref:Dihydroxyacetone kinase n=2 Tax=Sporothrix schenckii TaxID=29908 RepID=U7PXX3_SPOS1|nr:dihydroxyacetone kinase [Sporothrix schenckii 1099-18]ERS99325.1 dihydroxyacetone kinase [Sporothrix schenckii ATCC 58251]KJR82967.1 dihydroxyacetone kinase [Sporothrix schenckii 1099-18]